MKRKVVAFGGKLVLEAPLVDMHEREPLQPLPKVTALGLTVTGWPAFTAAAQALEEKRALVDVVAAALGAARGVPPRLGVLGDGRIVEQGADGLLRPVGGVVGEEAKVETRWELPGGWQVVFVDERRVDMIDPQNAMRTWTSRDSGARVAVARVLVQRQRIEERPTREQLIDALTMVPADASADGVYAARKGALMVLGVKDAGGVAGAREWFVAAQGRSWRTNEETAREVMSKADALVSVVEIRRFMEAGGVVNALHDLEQQNERLRRHAELADKGADDVRRQAAELRAKRDELRAKLRDRDADVKRVAVDSYQRGADAGVIAARAQMLEMRQQVDRLGVALAKAKLDAQRVNAEQEKRLNDATKLCEVLLASEKRLLDETKLLEQERLALEQRPICRTVTTVVRCKGGKELERTVETQILTGERAAAASAVATSSTGTAGLTWQKLGVGEPGEVLTVGGPSADGAGARLEPAKPTVDMARVEAVVRSDLEASRSRTRENVGAVLLLLLALVTSVAVGSFLGGPVFAQVLRALGAR